MFTGVPTTALVDPICACFATLVTVPTAAAAAAQVLKVTTRQTRIVRKRKGDREAVIAASVREGHDEEH
jgi:hypothetical protein